GATYRSRSISFVAVEEYTATLSATAPAGFPALDAPSPMVAGLLRRYDGGNAATFPFVDVGNRVFFVGATGTVSPQVLQGLSMAAVADDLSTPGTPQADVVLGEADAITAAICAMTGDTPAAVCTSTGVQAAGARIGVR
ncbi:MAG TPA: hypothetical protein VE991_00745, partial [Acidimicrobiales bacterium]|nr:hypothetical protein [Acidimicrobiales bacterium]